MLYKLYVQRLFSFYIMNLEKRITMTLNKEEFEKRIHALPGNDENYSVLNTQEKEPNALKGKKMIFLGSSVTYGAMSLAESFVDYLEKEDGIIPVKEAVSGTVLVDEDVHGLKSYIYRMKTIDKTFKADAFICQLSTNDATKGKVIGEISNTKDPKDFDIHTVAGAIEYIITYARDIWNCPIYFYTGTKFDNERYKQMVELLLEIQKKWDIGVIDLWNDEEMNSIEKETYDLYMADPIHPTRAGYREWWTPKIEKYLMEQFEK